MEVIEDLVMEAMDMEVMVIEVMEAMDMGVMVVGMVMEVMEVTEEVMEDTMEIEATTVKKRDDWFRTRSESIYNSQLMYINSLCFWPETNLYCHTKIINNKNRLKFYELNEKLMQNFPIEIYLQRSLSLSSLINSSTYRVM